MPVNKYHQDDSDLSAADSLDASPGASTDSPSRASSVLPPVASFPDVPFSGLAYGGGGLTGEIGEVGGLSSCMPSDSYELNGGDEQLKSLPPNSIPSPALSPASSDFPSTRTAPIDPSTTSSTGTDLCTGTVNPQFIYGVGDNNVGEASENKAITAGPPEGGLPLKVFKKKKLSEEERRQKDKIGARNRRLRQKGEYTF
jgi:hypothetical protein